jgi:L-ascorbate metabolism protein UlaG (beta-lactamase superfamily)
LEVAYHNHVCLPVENFFADPYIKTNPLAETIDLKEILADYILLSQGHDDYLADAIKIARYTKGILVANFEVVEWLEKKRMSKVHSLDRGSSLVFCY